jgi:energy-coupling factor transporter ATP-binding protein EcfA2
MPRNTTTPAEGERRAMSGYNAQYRVSASLILRALRNDSLQWIRVADPEAGRVDDLQIGSRLRVDAFQVKWAQYAGFLSFNDMISKTGNTPCLVNQLADGWGRLRSRFPNCFIMVHLVTNNMPSLSAAIPIGEPPPTPLHFAAFIEQVWNRARTAGSGWTTPEPWKPTWNKLQEASGLIPEDFEIFVRGCELEFGYRPPASTVPSTQQTIETDIGKIMQFLPEAVADPSRPVEFTREQLLINLGWKDRFEFKSRHEFPDPTIPYYPIDATVRRLEQSLSDLPGGYVAVLGTPGSGKSTLLTQTARLSPQRVVRYYAYVPNAEDPLTLRGESANFLHDMVLALERAGFRVGEGIGSDREGMLDRFYKQLHLLHEDFETTHRKTVIIIDGLDNISREQHPDRSLLRDLPLPEQVPDGVYFVLGSQTDQLDELPDRVQHAIRESTRRIAMEPLSREAVIQISERTRITLSNKQKEEIYVLSAGHPLALAYLLNRIKSAADTSVIEKILKDTTRYDGGIEAQYHSYWRQIETDVELVHLLALLARLRKAIDLSWLGSWNSYVVMSRFRTKLAHYFRAENENYWYFFHNSFRLFLLHKTAESPSGTLDASRNQALHHELAEICGRESSGSPWAWEQLYHLVAAREFVKVLELASQEYFRGQLLACRPVDAVQADIRLAMSSVLNREDPVALERLLLIGAEIQERRSYLEETPYLPLLLGLHEIRMAVEQIRDGNRLRANTASALRACLNFKSAGLLDESQRIFELAQPLDLLTQCIEDDPSYEKGKLLESWAEASVHFRDLEKIIEAIGKIRRGADRFRRTDAEKETQSLRNRMLFRAGLGLLSESRWDDLTILRRSLKFDDSEGRECWFWLQANAWRAAATAKREDVAKQLVVETLYKVDESNLGSEERVMLAEGVYRVLGDMEHARKCLQNVPQPGLVTDNILRDSGLRPFLHRFRLNRLLHALGDQRPPSEIILDADKPPYQGSVLFERAICEIAAIWGEAWKGRQSGYPDIQGRILSLLRLFNRQIRERIDWFGWFSLESIRGEFYELLVDAVAQHGSEALELFQKDLEREWSQPSNAPFWSSSVRRQVVLSFWKNGTRSDWAPEQLQKLEDKMLQGCDVQGRVEECYRQAEAWVVLNNESSARRLLRKMLDSSFGVGYSKDYQLNNWIQWLARINQLEPERAAERITWFARAIVTLKETTEGKADGYAAEELLAVTYQWSPRKAIPLLRWFLEQEVVSSDSAVRVLLRESLEAEGAPVEAVLSSLPKLLASIDDDLVFLMISAVAARDGNEKAVAIARNILTRFGSESWRVGIGRAFVALRLDLGEVGLKLSDLAPDPAYGTRFLRLSDGTTLHMEEVKLRIHSTSDIRDLLQKESKESYFDWVGIIDYMIGQLEQEEIQQLATLFQGRRHSALVLAALSERLLGLGDIRGAQSLAKQALDASGVYGWNKWYDGGTRLAAFRAFTSADPGQARPLLYSVLIRDLDEAPYPLIVALNMNEILPLLVDDLPIREIWSELEQYVGALFANSSLSASGPTGIDVELPGDAAENVIVDLVSISEGRL